MIKKKWLSMGAAVALIFMMTILLGVPEITRAKEARQEQCAVVDINGNNTIQPETLTIAKDDCVLWLNWGNGAEVIFTEGEKSKEMTKDPVRFKMDSEGRYLTDYLGPNETASLFFPKKGTFNYEIGFKPTAGVKQSKEPAEHRIGGTIVVE